MRMSETLDEYYDLVETYKNLDPYDREMMWSIMQVIKKTREKHKKDSKNTEES